MGWNHQPDKTSTSVPNWRRLDAKTRKCRVDFFAVGARLRHDSRGNSERRGELQGCRVKEQLFHGRESDSKGAKTKI